MGRLGKIVKGYIAKLSGNSRNAQVAAVEEFAGDQRKAQIFGPSNEDFSPPLATNTINTSIGRGRGFLSCVAFHNWKIAPVAKPGERRLFSTNSAGDTVQTEVFLKQDGTLYIANSAGVSITLTPAGELNIVTPGNSNISSSKTIINNDVDILGLLTANNITSLGSIAGVDIESSNSLTDKGTDVGGTHKHDGVTTGGGVTGEPI